MASIRLRVKQYAKIADAKGWRTDAAAAAAIGCNAATVWRVRKGQAAPGEQFIAGLLTAASPFTFDDLFEVVVQDDQDVA